MKILPWKVSPAIFFNSAMPPGKLSRSWPERCAWKTRTGSRREFRSGLAKRRRARRNFRGRFRNWTKISRARVAELLKEQNSNAGRTMLANALARLVHRREDILHCRGRAHCNWRLIFLTRYKALGALPSEKTIIMERFFDESGGMQLVIHSPFGARLNRAWGLALRKRFCRSFNFELQSAATDDAIVLSLGTQHSFPLEEVFRYLNSKTVREILVQALLDSPMFPIRWRWNATRSLALPRQRGGKKIPAPLQRMESENLLAAVFPDQLACPKISPATAKCRTIRW